jgi:hypothetical protein
MSKLEDLKTMFIKFNQIISDGRKKLIGVVNKIPSNKARHLLNYKVNQRGFMMVFALLIFLIAALHMIEFAAQTKEHTDIIEQLTAREVATEMAFDAGTHLQRQLSQQALDRIKPILQNFLTQRSATIKASEIRNSSGVVTAYNPSVYNSIMPSKDVWSISTPVSALKNLPNKQKQHLPLEAGLEVLIKPNTKQEKEALEDYKHFLSNEYDYRIATKFAGRQIIIPAISPAPGVTPRPAIEMYRWMATVFLNMRVYRRQQMALRFDYDIVALVTTTTPDLYIPPCMSSPVQPVKTSGFSDGRIAFFCNPVPKGEQHDITGERNNRADGADEYDCYSVETLNFNAMADPATYEKLRQKYLDNGGAEDIHDGLKQGESLNGSVLGNGTGQRNKNTKNLIIVGDRIDSQSVGAIRSDCGSVNGSDASKVNLTNNSFEVSVTTKMVAVHPGFEIAKVPLR